MRALVDRALDERVSDWLSSSCCSCGEFGGWFGRVSYESIDSASNDMCLARLACRCSCGSSCMDISD